MKHSNINTTRCSICGEPIGPGEGVRQRGENRTGFVHPGCQEDEGRHTSGEDPGLFDLGVRYTYNED